MLIARFPFPPPPRFRGATQPLRVRRAQKLFVGAALAAVALLAFLAPSAAADSSHVSAFGKTDADVLETVEVAPGLKKIVLARGADAADIPANGASISAHYTGRLAADGSKFDSSVDRGSPFSFQLGQGRVIKGWDLGFASMAVGEKAMWVAASAPHFRPQAAPRSLTVARPHAHPTPERSLVIDSELGYGARGAGGKIPGGATLLFEVELLSYKGARKEL